MLSEDVIYVPKDAKARVLILVLMEYALRVIMALAEVPYFGRLNPCFNGICSQRDVLVWKR